MRIDVADPGSERLVIVAALAAAGFEVRAIEIRDLPETRADLVVLAGDARDALEALRTLRDDGARPDVPVILVGTPEGTDPIASGPGFGAERVLGRPVDEARLVEAVHLLLRARANDGSIVERVAELTLELAQRERAAAWRTGDEEPERDDPSGVSAIHPMSAHDDVEGPSGDHVQDVPSSTSERPSSPARRPSVPPPPTGISVVERNDRASERPSSTAIPSSQQYILPGTGPGTGSDVVTPAAISDELRTLLSAADRRVFPSLAPVDVSIPAGEVSAVELVPDEFLDDAPFVDSEPEEEMLFLPPVPPVPTGWGAASANASASSSGSPAVAPTAPASRAEGSSPDAEPAKKTSPGTPGTVASRPPPRPAPTMVTGGENRTASRRQELPRSLPDDASLGRPGADGIRRLAIEPGAMLRALVALVLHRSTTRVEVRAGRATEPDVTLGFSRGELVSLDGPLHQQALALAQGVSGVPASSPLGSSAVEELASKDRLVSLMERREVSVSGSAFLLAAAERALLSQVLRLDAGEACFCTAGEREAPSRLGRTGPLLLSLARSLEPSVLARLAGEGAHLAPSRSFDSVCEALEAPRELVALFAGAADGVSPTDLARASFVMPGLVGMAGALFAGGGLSALSRQDDGGIDRRAAEGIVIEHARRAEDADYFTLLGVAQGATDSAIRDARDARVSLLAALPLDTLGLESLSASRRLAIEAVEEAAAALSSPRLRAAYARALMPAPPTGRALG